MMFVGRVQLQLGLILCVLIIAVWGSTPWYQARDASSAAPQQAPFNFRCETECSTTMDCATGLSCFQATADSNGCCLKALKPNETGCLIDDQCKRACESTHCDSTQSQPRCLCDTGRHFLFNKCWKKCPEFAHPEPVVDATGFSQCVLKVDSKTAMNYMRRFRRQMRSNFC
uniref:TIL domain-containing protein n=1 Tax=Panagrellus redivivus TaxID=6233 RepID=A0A7E4W5K8_PANRE